MPQDRPLSPVDTQLCLVVDSDPLAVRAALVRLMSGLAAKGLPEKALESVEIVLAEALNNVVEHAYSQAPGPIEVTLRLAGPYLECRICDRGSGMPDGILPKGAQGALTGPVDSLPEGGFGWFLIRKLADGIDYRRTGDRNQLAFRIRTDPASEIPDLPLPGRP